ncbi:hypothetical protein ANHS_1397 [Ligilactobacillus ruminis ATCC 25644]|nr:hypothetical protein ANHS_1397 [Ligilactobacillus ruminis ATCC 25644]
MPFIRAAALIRAIHNLRKLDLFFRRSRKAYWYDFITCCLATLN